MSDTIPSKNDLEGKRLREVNAGMPTKAQLLNVAVWLENGCNPKHAAEELRLMIRDWNGHPNDEYNRLRAALADREGLERFVAFAMSHQETSGEPPP